MEEQLGTVHTMPHCRAQGDRRFPQQAKNDCCNDLTVVSTWVIFDVWTREISELSLVVNNV